MKYGCLSELFNVVFKMILLSAHKILDTLLRIDVVCVNNLKDRM